MEPHTRQQLQGAVHLITDTVEVAATNIGAAHQAIVRRIYAPFSLLGPLAVPVQAIEQIQQGITAGVYQTIRTINQLVGKGATALIEQLEEQKEQKPAAGIADVVIIDQVVEQRPGDSAR